MNDSDYQHAIERLGSASRIFYVIAAVKSIATVLALRLLMARGAPPLPKEGLVGELVASAPGAVAAGLVAWYAASAVFCIAVGRNLQRRRRWAATAGTAYALFQIAGLLLFRWLGAVTILNAFLGVIAFLTLHVAIGLGAFDAPPSDSEV